MRVSPGGSVDVTIHWLFATGRSHPVFAITFDATPAGQNAVNADTRAPYGNLNFDGVSDGSGDVAGVGWGDQYRFTTTGSGPVTMESTWSYTDANTVPYVVMWAAAADAEMGAVQTQTFDQHVAGGDYGGGMLADCQGHTSASPGGNCTSGHTMPTDWLWPYQLNQYELPYVTTSKRLAWGANYGAIGQVSYSAFGRTLSGYPRVSYSVYVVLGPHSDGTVAAQVAEVESVQHTQLTATKGTVWTTGPAGVGRSDTATLQPAGWDPRYGTWNVAAAANQATVTFAVSSGTLRHPVLVVSGYTASAAPPVKLDGATLTNGVDYLASVDTTGSQVWITLLRELSGSHTVEVL
jgi:hypothetical protein